MLADYAGARGRLTIEQALKLGRGWAFQVKIDGCYVRATTDAAGRITHLLQRSGRPIELDLVGVATGLPDAVLHGELEAHTEAGRRAAETRGWAALHLFDVTCVRRRPLHREPYQDRYARLHAYQAEAELGGRDTWWTIDGRGAAHDAGGRFCRPVPRDLRRCPVVPMARSSSAAAALWREHVEVGGGEGLVAVRLEAPLGVRGAKKKVKATDELDCRVLEVGGGVARLAWKGGTFLCSARGRWAALCPGQVVSCAHDGYYEAGCTPRFARIRRERPDLTAAGA
jgi:hypothetical protein